jgi:type II secretory pathway component PulM
MQSLVQSIVDQQMESKKELKAAMAGGAPKKKYGAIALVVLLVVNVGAWVLFPPTRDRSGDIRTPIEIERDLRVLIAATAGEIEAWRKKNNNAVPATLADVGVTDTTVGYALIDSTTYILRGTSSGISATYRSTLRVQDFLDATPGIRR